MFSKPELDAAMTRVRMSLPATPQYAWPQLRRRLGMDVIVKHENHLPTGAFKVRGGLVYLDRLRARCPDLRGVITATRGNHGQSIAYAAGHNGIKCTVLVPHGNSREKNASMRDWGAEVIEVGRDFDETREHLGEYASRLGYESVPSFHRDLVTGVATYALELFTPFADLDAVYVPIGLGSGICGVIRTRDLLGLKTEVIGVVSKHANAYARSFSEGRVVTTASALTFRAGASRVIEVSEESIAEAIRIYHEETHNLAEGAGAAALAGLVQERELWAGRRCGVILCGGNIDRDWAACVLGGGVPVPR
jgi:threonine dehydratase